MKCCSNYYEIKLYMLRSTEFLFFFFQAEDGIRDLTVTGVQTCALPIYAAQAGKFMLERMARVPVEVDYASEWRYRDPIIPSGTITLLISQSGETADTIAAQREAKAKGSKTLAICNVVGSMITREAAGTIYTHAGPEIGVASRSEERRVGKECRSR